MCSLVPTVGSECPSLQAEKQELCNEIVNFVESKSPDGRRFPSIFEWLNNGDKKKTLNIRKSGSDATMSDVVADPASDSRVLAATTSQSDSIVCPAHSLHTVPGSAPDPNGIHVINGPTASDSPRTQSLSDRLKAQFLALIGPAKPATAHSDPDLYKQLINHILNNEAHIFDKPWPPLDGPLPEEETCFQVREFPLSSKPIMAPSCRLLHKSVEIGSVEDVSLLTDDEAEMSDDVFENAHLETSLFTPIGVRPKPKADEFRQSSVPNGVTHQNGHCNMDVALKRERVSSDPTDAPVAHLADGYSADESSLNSSFADLLVEPRQRKAAQNGAAAGDRLRRHTRSHAEPAPSKKAPSLEAPRRCVAGKHRPASALRKSMAAPETDSDATDPAEAPTYHRYYHVFKKGELVRLFAKYVPEVKVVEVYFDHGNWCVVGEKQ